MAAIVPTLHADIPWCISAPTMRVPRVVADTVNAYLAFRAALRAVLAHNASDRPAIRRILCPGLGTSMRAAWDRVLGPQAAMPRSVRAADGDELALLR